MRSLAFAAAVAWCALGQPAQPFFPVGVRIDSPTAISRDELQALRALRFNIVEFPNQSGSRSVAPIAQLLGEASPLVLAVAQPSVVALPKDPTGADVRLLAWESLARGARAVIFSDLAALQRRPDALKAAAEFADNVTRNAALFAPLLPRSGPPLVRVERGRRVSASFLESADALVLIALNASDRAEQVRLAFAPDIPEAIWQNMESGAAVNFVAGPAGPLYERAFPPKDVLVLMIRKRWK